MLRDAESDVFPLLTVPERFQIIQQSFIADYMHESRGCDLRRAMPAGVLLVMANYIVKSIVIREAGTMVHGDVPRRIVPGKNIYCTVDTGSSSEGQSVENLSKEDTDALQEEEEKADEELRPCGGMATFNNLRGKGRS